MSTDLLAILNALEPNSLHLNEPVETHSPYAAWLAREQKRQIALWQNLPKLCGLAQADASDLFDSETTTTENFDELLSLVAGCDEVGRGPLAGPLTAAAVILRPHAFIPGLRDSKQLSPQEREALVPWIKAQSLAWVITDIDLSELNRPQANINSLALLAMNRSLHRLGHTPSLVLVDGRCRLPEWSGRQCAVIKGDDRCLSIAAASVLAKVHRDALLDEADKKWPQYGFAEHKGYGTAAHMLALQRYGICPYHRLNFTPIAKLQSSLEQEEKVQEMLLDL